MKGCLTKQIKNTFFENLRKEAKTEFFFAYKGLYFKNQ